MWFEQLFGFEEASYDETKKQFEVEGDHLRSLANGRSFRIGKFTTPSLAALRHESSRVAERGSLRFEHVAVGDVLELHALPENRGAMFQVASQFNCLEFPSPLIVPEHGVSSYEFDRTQGPACSLAAAAATVYRNYLVPCGDGIGQRSDCQIDNLSGLAADLGEPDEFWSVRNGYTFSTPEQLAALEERVAEFDREELLAKVAIGVQYDVGVTFESRFVEVENESIVSQAFCSAVSCAYTAIELSEWQPLAQLVLDAAYEATLHAAAIHASRSGERPRLWLTLLGGGAFGNDPRWLATAIARALNRCQDLAIDVRLAHYRERSAEFEAMIDAAR